MQDHNNLLPIDSDVKQYLDKKTYMFDTQIADVFKELKFEIVSYQKTHRALRRSDYL